MPTPPNPGSIWSGTLVLGSGLVVYDGPGASAAHHRHDAVQFTLGVDAPVQLTLAGTTSRARAVAITSRTDHELVATGRTIVVLVEPVGRVGAAAAGFASRNVHRDLDGVLSEPPPGDPPDPDALIGWARRSLESLTAEPSSFTTAGVAPLTAQLIDFVDARLTGVPRLTDAAAALGVSPRHLRRLVAGDLGMPFPRYVLWRRLGRAVLAVRDGSDLTTASATAGFADSAHFSRVFRSMFGLSPSDVLPIATIARSEFPGGS